MDAKVVGEVLKTYEDDWPSKTNLVQCPECRNALVGVQEQINDESWTSPSRVWREPPLSLDGRIPRVVRDSLAEAHACLRGKTYTASAAMTGRAVEGVCRHFGMRSQYLKDGLKELNRRRIISAQLNKWARELHLHRNAAAHADPKRFSKDEAKDLLKFAIAICNYVFVHTSDYKAFMKRKSKQSATKSLP